MGHLPYSTIQPKFVYLKHTITLFLPTFTQLSSFNVLPNSLIQSGLQIETLIYAIEMSVFSTLGLGTGNAPRLEYFTVKI